MFLIYGIKPNVEKKFKTCVIFTQLFRGGKLGEYEINPVLFLFMFGLLTATKLYSKETRIEYMTLRFKCNDKKLKKLRSAFN